MKEERLEQLRKEYMEIPIPDELDLLVGKTLKESINKKKRKRSYRGAGITAASVAATFIIFIAGINANPVFAQALSDMPVVGDLVRVLTFREYIVQEDTYDANIKVPQIEGLENSELENYLNTKYLEENKELYNQFIADMESLEKSGGGHMGVDSGYVIKTDNDRILSVGRYVVNTAASSSTTFQFDTIDKQKEILITLPSLFVDKRYIDIISVNIKSQMVEQMKTDENKVYWVEGFGEDLFDDNFEKIAEGQNFYINDSDKLVISFDKYQVAPGYMGVAEFQIPTDILSDILVSNEYIK